MLSLHRGDPIAQINYKDKKRKVQKIFINTDDDTEDNDIDSKIKDEVLPKSFYTSLKNVNPANMILLKRAIRLNKKDIVGNNLNLQDAYNRAQEMLKEILRKYINIAKSDGYIEVIPSDKWDGHISVYGASGAGKSVWISKWLIQYKLKNPKSVIYIFSPLKDDEAYKNIKVQYVKLDESIIEDPLDVSEFENSVLVFDDIESIRDKSISDSVKHFRDCVLETGRHFNEIAICVSHILLNGPSTKRMLNESSTIVVFPKTNFNAIKNLCVRYFGMGRDDINYVKTIIGRWLVIKRNYPSVLISEQAVKLL